MIIDTAYVSETVRVTREIEAAKRDLEKDPSYGRALAVQQSRRIRDERVAVARASFRIIHA